MKKLSLALALGALLWAACDKKNGDIAPKEKINCGETPELCQLSEANNDFGFRLFRTLCQKEPQANHLISPLSVAVALSMALNGADGETAAEMRQTLALQGFAPAEANEAFRLLLKSLPQLDPTTKMSIANSLWYSKDFDVKPDYINALEAYFLAQCMALDFRNPQSKDQINNWVKAQTQNLIPKIVDEIRPEHVAFLINAVYFEGLWRRPFDPKHTADATFRNQDGTVSPVKMMRTVAPRTTPFFYHEKFSMIDLAYGDSTYSMSILLPHPDVQIGEVAALLESGQWNTWIKALQPADVQIEMPRFELEYDKELKEALTYIGIQRAFSESGADFSKLSAQSRVFISGVKHKSVLKVSEKGTQAAAVTSVDIVNTSLPPSITLDRPFVLAIRERSGGAVLFLGKVARL
ncbi:MAG: serpin family protein [Saprospiraceae bacterium]